MHRLTLALLVLLLTACGSDGSGSGDEPDEPETEDPEPEGATQAPAEGRVDDPGSCSLGEPLEVAALAGARDVGVARAADRAIVWWRDGEGRVSVRPFADGAPSGEAVTHEVAEQVTIVPVGDRWLMRHGDASGTQRTTLGPDGAAVGEAEPSPVPPDARAYPAGASTYLVHRYFDDDGEHARLWHAEVDDGRVVIGPWELDGESRFHGAQIPGVGSDGSRLVAVFPGETPVLWRSDGGAAPFLGLEDAMGHDLDVVTSDASVWVTYGDLDEPQGERFRRLVNVELSGRAHGPWLVGAPGTHPRPSLATPTVVGTELRWLGVGGETVGDALEVARGAVVAGDGSGALLAWADTNRVSARAVTCDPARSGRREQPRGTLARIRTTSFSTDGPALGLVTRDDHAWVLRQDGVEELTFENPRRAESVSHRVLELEAPVRSLAIVGDLALFAAGDRGVGRARLDAEDGVAFESPDGWVRATALVGHDRDVFVGVSTAQGARVVKLRVGGDPGSAMSERTLTVAGSVDLGGVPAGQEGASEVRDLRWVGGNLVAAIAGAQPQVRVIGVSGDELSSLGRAGLPLAPVALDADGSRVVAVARATDQPATAFWVSIEDPASPRLVHRFGDSPLTDVAVVGVDAYVSMPDGTLAHYVLDDARGPVASGLLIGPLAWTPSEDPAVGPRLRASGGTLVQAYAGELAVVRIRRTAVD